MITGAPELKALLCDFRAAGAAWKPIVRWILHPNPQFRRNRSQAIIVLPILALPLSTHPSVPLHLEIEAVIDRGDALIQNLALMLGVPRGTIRALIGHGPKIIGREWVTYPTELLNALGMIPADRRPRNPEEWALLREFWVACDHHAFTDYLVRPGDFPQRPMINNHVFRGLCIAGYEQSAARLDKLLRGQRERLYGVCDYFRFVEDWFDEELETWCGHDWVRNLTPSMLRDEFLMRYSAMELVRQSEAWHRDIAQYDGDPSTQAGDIGLAAWPALPGLPFQADNELNIIALTSPDQLLIESALLGHCVASYSTRCLLGESHIVSIRTPSGPLATAEISLETDRAGRICLRLVQHEARRGTKPDLRCMYALDRALQLLRSETMQEPLAEILAFHARRRDEIAAKLSESRARHVRGMRSDIMKTVLRDDKRASAWIEKRLDEEEAWYRHSHGHGGLRFRRRWAEQAACLADRNSRQ